MSKKRLNRAQKKRRTNRIISGKRSVAPIPARTFFAENVDFGITYIQGHDWFAVQASGIDPDDLDDFLKRGDIVHCPQYGRLIDSTQHVNLDMFLEHKRIGHEIVFYLDQNMVSSVLSMMDGASPYDPPFPNKPASKTMTGAARMMALGWLLGAEFIYDQALLEYSTHRNNSLEKANVLLRKFKNALEIQGPHFQKMANDPSYRIQTNLTASDFPPPLEEEEQTNRYAYSDSYQACLKLAHMKMKGKTGMDAFHEYLAWLHSSHFIAASSIGLAIMQFLAPGKKPMSDVKTAASIQNAYAVENVAWDLTHARTLNEVIKRRQDDEDACYAFCSGDERLIRLMNLTWDIATDGSAGVDSLSREVGCRAADGSEKPNPSRAADIRQLIKDALSKTQDPSRRANCRTRGDLERIAFTESLEIAATGCVYKAGIL